MKPSVTIVGCGQIGTNIAKRLQKSNNLKIMETSFRKETSQHPWGWMRRVTLQQKSRLRLPLQNLDLENKIKGPMIISTNSAHREYLWKDWLHQTKTDAKLMTREEGLERFGLSDRVQLLCDSQDFLFDFDQHKESLIQELQKTCDWFEKSPIEKIHWHKKRVVGLVDKNNTYHEVKGKILFCLGNQTRQFLETPTMGIRLAYNVIPTSKNKSKEKYIASWRDYSSIQHFPNYTKIGCGFQGTIDYLPPLQYAHLFTSFLAKPNYSFLFSPLSQMKQAKNDANGTVLEDNHLQTCTVDITPSFLPRIQVIGNAIFIYGMSGSGFTVYEPWFQDLIFNLVQGKAIDNPFANSHLVKEKSFLY